MKQVLFVCTGNTCRSPMAEAAFNVLAGAHGIDWRAGSAGTCAWPGGPASNMAQRAVAEIGGDLGGFRSRPLSRAMIEESDLIVAMTADHREDILAGYPSAAGKTRLLLEFAPGNEENVADPYGGSLDLYRYTLEAMMPALDGLIGKMSKNLI